MAWSSPLSRWQFSAGPTARLTGPSIAFLCIPLALWPAFRLGQLETSWTALLFSGIAVWGTFTRFGPYGLGPPGRGLLLAQAFGAVVALRAPRWRPSSPSDGGCTGSSRRALRDRTEQLRLANDELHVEIAARERVQAALAIQRGAPPRSAGARTRGQLGEWDVEQNVHRWSDEGVPD